MGNPLLILLQLLLAHIITDFMLQPNTWISHKRKYKVASIYLYLHSFIAGLLTYIILQKWQYWYIAIIITVSHFFIDLWKLQHKRDNLKIFVLDQVLHLMVLLLVWLYMIHGFREVIPFVKSIFSSISLLAIISGYLVVIFPTGYLIGKATRRWQEEIETANKKNSLEAAGRYIGIFERILVLTFILTNNFSAIGFLIAAKSILRFSDKTEVGARKQTEYVLIGTLMSFAITIILGFLIHQITL